MTMLSRKFSFVCISAIAALLTATRLQAAILSPGATLFPVPPELDPSGGTVIASITTPITSGAFSGTLTSEVIQGDTSNLLGGLTFTYVLTNDATSIDSLDRITVSSFAGFSADASYQATGGTAPTLVTRAVSGDVVGFNFIAGIGPGALAPGATSAKLVVQTDATTYARVSASVIDSTVATTDSFAPASSGGSIPEPATLSLAAAGAMALLIRRRRA
jgi:hypothetical protein